MPKPLFCLLLNAISTALSTAIRICFHILLIYFYFIQLFCESLSKDSGAGQRDRRLSFEVFGVFLRLERFAGRKGRRNGKRNGKDLFGRRGLRRKSRRPWRTSCNGRRASRSCILCYVTDFTGFTVSLHFFRAVSISKGHRKVKILRLSVCPEPFSGSERGRTAEPGHDEQCHMVSWPLSS